MRPDDNEGDLAPAGKQEAYLPVDFPGKLRHLAGKLSRDDPVRRNPSLVEPLKQFLLRRRQAGRFSVYPFDNCCPGFSFRLGAAARTLAYFI